jgi:hypothetical protein
MRTPEQYVDLYLSLDFLLKGTGGNWGWVRGRVRQYLQHQVGTRSANAQKAKKDLYAAAAKRIGLKDLPGTFKFEGYDMLKNNLERVFMGKGAPDEIQDVIWMASHLGLVSRDTLPSYLDNNIGIDCGGFAACFWGMGRPSPGAPAPIGWSGFTPRYFWETYRGSRRKNISQISAGDAIIFFRDVISDNPDVAKKRDTAGKLIQGTGSEAFHIGVVDAASEIDKSTIFLSIAESSGGTNPTSLGNGVRSRSIARATIRTDRQGWVFHEGTGNRPDGTPVTSRLYFVGRPAGSAPYSPWYDE